MHTSSGRWDRRNYRNEEERHARGHLEESVLVVFVLKSAFRQPFLWPLRQRTAGRNREGSRQKKHNNQVGRTEILPSQASSLIRTVHELFMGTGRASPACPTPTASSSALFQPSPAKEVYGSVANRIPPPQDTPACRHRQAVLRFPNTSSPGHLPSV